MEEITRCDLINLLKEKFPKFIPYWEEYISDCGGTDLGISNDMTPFFDYALDEIKFENCNEVEKIFSFVEFLMCNGDKSVKNAIAICFLEDLLNQDPNEIQFVKFSQYLGKESIGYLRAWNEFHGAHTEGL